MSYVDAVSVYTIRRGQNLQGTGRSVQVLSGHFPVRVKGRGAIRTVGFIAVFEQSNSRIYRCVSLLIDTSTERYRGMVVLIWALMGR